MRKVSNETILSHLQANIESLIQARDTLTQKDQQKLSDLTDLMLSLI